MEHVPDSKTAIQKSISQLITNCFGIKLYVTFSFIEETGSLY